jgi:hypothetical protein
VVHATGGVDLGLELAGDVGELGALQDVEVVIGGVATTVAFSSNGGTCGENTLEIETETGKVLSRAQNSPKMIRYSVILA